MQLLSRALCAAFLLNAGAAQAFEPVIETTALSIGGNGYDPVVDISLIGETNTSVSFSLHGIAGGYSLGTDSSYQPFSGDYLAWNNFYDIAVKDGYKVTGITVSGHFWGELSPAQWTMPGVATNEMSFSFDVHQLGNPPIESNGAHAQNLNTQQAFSLVTGGTALQGEFSVSFAGFNSVGAESVMYYDELYNETYWLGSRAYSGMGDLVMTIEVSPVPEPATYGMMLGGMGLLAFAARRRRA
ncbi:PEP-CTERM sorting domain-containing protein [Massilia sp. METH4]|uniref:PEP-CTERM sorting domain-containing protein n=1 Tax=Massilia sp. METH4 TaxID=3123041 RepID=UPI0030CBD1C9